MMITIATWHFIDSIFSWHISSSSASSTERSRSGRVSVPGAVAEPHSRTFLKGRLLLIIALSLRHTVAPFKTVQGEATLLCYMAFLYWLSFLLQHSHCHSRFPPLPLAVELLCAIWNTGELICCVTSQSSLMWLIIQAAIAAVDIKN